MNDYSSKVKIKIAEWRNTKWQKILMNAKPKYWTLWKLINQRKKTWPQISPLLTKSGYVFSDIDKTNVIAEELENVYKMNSNLGTIGHQKTVVRKVNKYIKESVIEASTIKLTTPREVSVIIKKVKNNKAPGLDEITYSVFKKLPKKGIVFITKLIKSIMILSQTMESG